jgi:HD-like signal output (HDOD) protein/ActR/RegA family two-component response regulator
MLTIMLMCVNERERQILKTAFEQLQFKTVVADASYGSYVKTVQYMPDVVMIELPRLCSEQLTYIDMLKKHKKARMIPVIAYGDMADKSIIRGIVKKGVDDYVERPLKFSNLVKTIGLRLKQRNKSIEATAVNAGPSKSDKEEDIEKILSPHTLRTQKIELMVKHISKLMAFPFTVAKVLQLADSEKAGAGDLSKILEADPVIAANILKVSNTVFFASANRRINSIKDAIVRVGFRETKRIVMSMSVMDLFNTQESRLGFNRYHFWFHCLGTAIIAEDMAKRIGDLNAEEAFLAGLLHDFGLILLDEFYPSIFGKVLEATAASGAHFVDKELEILDITHIDVVSELFQSWKIPENITEAIVNHYTISQAGDRLDSVGKKLAQCVAMGNVASKALSLGSACDQYVFPLPDNAFQMVKMLQGFGPNFEKEINHDAKLFCQFLKIDEAELQDRKGGLLGDRQLKIGVANLAKDIFIPPEMYLKTQGHTIERLPPGDGIAEAHGKYDLILAWTNETTPVQAVSPLLRLTQRQESETTIQLVPPRVPLLLFARNGEDYAELNDEPNLSAMFREYDQRQLDVNILAIMEGRKVEFQSPS